MRRNPMAWFSLLAGYRPVGINRGFARQRGNMPQAQPAWHESDQRLVLYRESALPLVEYSRRAVQEFSRPPHSNAGKSKATRDRITGSHGETP
jgi:hypothetical protein